MKRKASSSAHSTPSAKKRKLSKPNLLRQTNTVRGGPEKKNVDVLQTIALPVSGLSIAPVFLSPIAQGSSSTNRLARKTKLTSIQFNYTLAGAVGAGFVGGTDCRIKIVYDKQSNGTTPAATGVVAVDTLTSPNNLDFSDRFITLVDIITQPVSVQNNTSISGKISRKLDLEQIWDGTVATGTAADIATGSIWLYAWQTGSATGATPPSLEFFSRIRYEDN